MSADDAASRLFEGRPVLEWTVDLIDAFSPEKRARAAAVLASGDAGTARLVIGASGMAGSDGVRESVRAALVGIGAQAVEPLVEKLDDTYADETFLISTLAAMPTWAVRPLWDRATDRSGTLLTRVRALRALAAMRPVPDRVGDLLAFIMRDETDMERVREEAVACIASWDPTYAEAEPVAHAILQARAQREGARDAELAAEREARALAERTSVSERVAAEPSADRLEQTPDEAALITRAVASRTPLRVACMECGAPCTVAGIAAPTGSVVTAAPEVVNAAALYCRRCDIVVCARCAGTEDGETIGGGECPRCFRGMEPADVTELPGTGVRVLAAG